MSTVQQRDNIRAALDIVRNHVPNTGRDTQDLLFELAVSFPRAIMVADELIDQRMVAAHAALAKEEELATMPDEDPPRPKLVDFGMSHTGDRTMCREYFGQLSARAGDEMRTLLDPNNPMKVGAIKLLRTETGLGLKDAKDIIEWVMEFVPTYSTFGRGEI